MQSEVLSPAVKGTLNVLQACSANNVQKVVVVSSTAAVYFNPSWPQGRTKDESCWSDRDLCIKNEVSDAIPVPSILLAVNMTSPSFFTIHYQFLFPTDAAREDYVRPN
jgi:nucleoside-diphosphate-sugar epimerase